MKSLKRWWHKRKRAEAEMDYIFALGRYESCDHCSIRAEIEKDREEAFSQWELHNNALEALQ